MQCNIGFKLLYFFISTFNLLKNWNSKAEEASLASFYIIAFKKNTLIICNDLALEFLEMELSKYNRCYSLLKKCKKINADAFWIIIKKALPKRFY